MSLNPRLRDYVQHGLDRRWSPEQIAHQLRRDFPGDPEMRVTHETVYPALYVQGRGELRREMAQVLRTGRARRKPHRRSNKRRPRFTAPMVMISDRPAEAEDRAVPGHWEGDCIVGPGHRSAIGTLVERSTRFLMLIHLPDGHRAEHFHQALTDTVTQLPPHLRGSLNWDQGNEMASHQVFSTATDMPVYFCNPGSPWQRGSNENTSTPSRPNSTAAHPKRSAGRPSRASVQARHHTSVITCCDDPWNPPSGVAAARGWVALGSG